jgi:hypothetical protein
MRWIFCTPVGLTQRDNGDDGDDKGYDVGDDYSDDGGDGDDSEGDDGDDD